MESAVKVSRGELTTLDPKALRSLIRKGEWTGWTTGLAMGYAQANLAILPLEYAFEFLAFCQRNPRPCALLEVTDPGSPVPRQYGPEADLRTDLPRYRVFEHGRLVDEPTDITSYWRSDLVAFLIGCSLTFEGAMVRANIPVRHLEDGKDPAVYITNIQCLPAGRFRGPMVVSMRPMRADQVVRAVQVTSRFPLTHGAPVHIGDPQTIGIPDLSKTDWGDAQRFEPGEVPVFWGCGVTPQVVALESKPSLMITHLPGHMFVTDRRDEETAIL